MKFSKKSQYALRALLELTRAYEQGPLRRTDIAQKQQIPVGFLESILLALKNTGVLASRPGAFGGFELIKPPNEISLGKIIRTLDGPLAPIACVSKTAYQTCADCPYVDANSCPIQRVMLEVRNAIAAVLDHYTLQDFAGTQSGQRVKMNHAKVRTMKNSRSAAKSGRGEAAPRKRQ